MLSLCVMYVRFGSKVRPRTVGCVVKGSAVLFILRSSSACCFVWILCEIVLFCPDKNFM